MLSCCCAACPCNTTHRTTCTTTCQWPAPATISGYLPACTARPCLSPLLLLLLLLLPPAGCCITLASPPLLQGPNALSWDSDILEELGRLQKKDFGDKEVGGGGLLGPACLPEGCACLVPARCCLAAAW